MTLKAEAAQALAGILVGQVEGLLQVLSGRLLHVQLLCILLVEEANFLPPRRGRWSVKAQLPLWSSYSLIRKADLPAGGSFSFPPESARKEQEGETGKEKVLQAHIPAFRRGDRHQNGAGGRSVREREHGCPF